MTQGQRLNLKWSVADMDRLAKMSISGMSDEQICEELAGTGLESSPTEIARLCQQARRSLHYPAVASR